VSGGEVKLPLDRQCELAGYPAPQAEWRFHPTRRWRFDWAFPAVRFAVEVEGGGWIGGRHTRGAGFEKDLDKYAEALVLGWRVLRVTPKQVNDGRALQLIERILRQAQ
jgi:very-short-patch-repair endonuclease